MEDTTEDTIDLFENPDDLPKEVQDILNEFAEMSNTYETCAFLVIELEKVGYTCNYGLDAVPYNLTKINLEITK